MLKVISWASFQRSSTTDFGTLRGAADSNCAIGKTRLRTLPPGERSRFRQWTENYRRFRYARASLVKLHQAMLVRIDRLEKTLRRPPPQPSRRRGK